MGSAVGTIVYLVVLVAVIAGIWRMFQKANRPGWGAIIPFYNTYLLLKVAGRPGWWLILFFIPIVELIIYIIVMLDIGKAFGKGTGFGIGLILLPFIFMPILGFGDAQYIGPVGGTSRTAFAS